MSQHKAWRCWILYNSNISNIYEKMWALKERREMLNPFLHNLFHILNPFLESQLIFQEKGKKKKKKHKRERLWTLRVEQLLKKCNEEAEMEIKWKF